MKNLRIVFVLLLWATLSALHVHGQAAPKLVKSVVIHTSATCDECKVIIESALKKVKGVKKSNLDLVTKDVTVSYADWKTNPETLRKAISMAGYDADDVKADQEAHDNLPKCCKSGMEE